MPFHYALKRWTLPMSKFIKIWKVFIERVEWISQQVWQLLRRKKRLMLKEHKYWMIPLVRLGGSRWIFIDVTAAVKNSQGTDLVHGVYDFYRQALLWGNSAVSPFNSSLPGFHGFWGVNKQSLRLHLITGNKHHTPRRSVVCAHSLPGSLLILLL